MIKKIWRKFLTVFGDIKIFKFPMFIVYQPKGYRVMGAEIEKILNIVKEGDILVRGYYDYLDGKFIDGFFSHAGFYYGENKVIHAIAEGVVEGHLIDFCKCDYLAIIRFYPENINEEDIKLAKEKALSIIGYAYDFEFDGGENELYCTKAVLEIWKHKSDILNIVPIKSMFNRYVIFPDQLYNCNSLDKIFKTSNVV